MEGSAWRHIMTDWMILFDYVLSNPKRETFQVKKMKVLRHYFNLLCYQRGMHCLKCFVLIWNWTSHRLRFKIRIFPFLNFEITSKFLFLIGTYSEPFKTKSNFLWWKLTDENGILLRTQSDCPSVWISLTGRLISRPFVKWLFHLFDLSEDIFKTVVAFKKIFLLTIVNHFISFHGNSIIENFHISDFFIYQDISADISEAFNSDRI